MAYHYLYISSIEGSKANKLYMFLVRMLNRDKAKTKTNSNINKINTAIIGAGKTGVDLAESIKNNPVSNRQVFFFIDTDPEKIGKILNGLRVYDQNNDCYKLFTLYNIEEVIVCLSNSNSEQLQSIFNFLSKTKCRIKMYDDTLSTNLSLDKKIHDFGFEDFFQRSHKLSNLSEFSDFYKDKAVLITGAGGSIGSEITRQISTFKLKKLVLLDIYENEVYNLYQDLIFENNKKYDIKIEIITITDKDGLEYVFKLYKPDIVIHAAAHKHVPLMEHNVVEATKNNIFGTLNLLELSKKYKIEKFMMLSTDKAVNPTNIMGATKRFCELLVAYFSNRSRLCCYSATRFGNVLGSAGSVVPLFQKQIDNGGPVTITDKNVVRYFMSIPEASNLVINATARAKNGELYVLDMGHQIKIYDLAKQLIKLSGKNYIEIKEIGLRPGEKLYEEILINEKKHKKTSDKSIYVEKALEIKIDINKYLNQLKVACDNYDSKAIINILKKCIPEYKDADSVNKIVSKYI